MKKLHLILLITLSLNCYAGAQVSNLETFIVQFGRAPVDYSPEIFIEFASVYNQDISTGGNRIGNITRITTPVETIILNPPGENNFYPDLEHEWRLQDTLVTTSQNPTMAEIKLSRSGIMWLELSIRHAVTGVTFTRGKWVYLQYNEFNDLPNSGIITDAERYVPEGEVVPSSSFGVFVSSYPAEYIPFDHIMLDHDYNQNGIVDVMDLGMFLSGYGQF